MSLKFAILGLLTYQPMTGYELKSVFDDSINYFWTAQLSQIYRELGSLESRGYVASHIEPQEGRPDKRVYSITVHGDTALQEWLNKFPQALSIAVRDEVSLRIFFGSYIAPEEIKFQLRKLIKEKQEGLEHLNSLNKAIGNCAKEANKSEDAFFQRLVLRKGITVFEAEIRWAEECLKELEDLPSNIKAYTEESKDCVLNRGTDTPSTSD